MPDDNLIRNEYGETVLMDVGAEKMPLDSLGGGETPTQLANWYLEQHLDEMGLAQSRMAYDERLDSLGPDDPTPVIEFSHEKDIQGSAVVVYRQWVMGLPIFDARVGVHINASEMAVTSMQSSMHGQVEVANPEQKAETMPKPPTKTALRKMLGHKLPNLDDIRIPRQVVYRYEPDQRAEHPEDEHVGCFAEEPVFELDLPPLPDGIEKGMHYIVNEVLFRASRWPDEDPVNWRALVEPETNAVLYVRALVAHATALVFVRDPQTQSGAAVTGASSDAILNPFRTSVSLPGITAATPQPLAGEYVALAETSAPAIAAPVGATPTSAFNFNVRSDDFSAANAYYHCDNLFRTMATYGFDVFSYFDNTSFPVPVDHRALGSAVNAQAPGNATGNGLGELRFALLQAGQPVGIATSNRVVWHEFGHALLWDHVNSPNFGFAHSAGDSLAAILNDPGTKAGDRFNTFPWIQAATNLNRRHDRAVADGWAWFGPQYNTQYQGEQILCTTLFRLYRAIGGDASTTSTQTRAAQTVAYLIFKAIGLLTATTPYPQVFVTNLQNADRTTPSFKGIPGGALHKVVRWAFEKQGLFQPNAQPNKGNIVNREGNPPDVDVYIDDGRNGEYQYQANFWNCQELWVRRAADGGLTHEHPVVGQTNYLYVRVRNRGTKTATAVKVAAFHALPGTGLVFPDDWAPMDTPVLPAGGPIAPGAERIVGPFEFVPTQVGHECLLAIAEAAGDPGNDTTITGSIPASRLVSFDNNIAQRNVSPVLPTPEGLLALLGRHPLWVRNPLKKTAICRIEIAIPRLLEERGWEMQVLSPGGRRFELGPRERHEVTLALRAGEDFSEGEAREAMAEGDGEITVMTYIDDELSGGMSYPFSFDAGKKEDKPQEPRPPRRPVRRPLTLLDILRLLGFGNLTDDNLTSEGRIRRVRLELDLVDDDDG